MHNAASPRLSLLGPCALLCEGAAPPSIEAQTRIWGIADIAASWKGVSETVPGVNNVLVVFDPDELELSTLTERVLEAWSMRYERAPSQRAISISVTYGEPHAEDLHVVAKLTGLTVGEIVQLHTAPDYTVFAVGSHPGFGYLFGLDPRLVVPRRNTPRLQVKAGSVVLAAGQTGVVACDAPSGWHVIGSTTLTLFDPHANPPSVLQPGDRIRFSVEAVCA